MNAKVRWLNDDEQALWREMLAANRKINRVMEETLQQCSELSVSEYSVLVCLSEAPNHQLRLRDICLSLDWDRSRTSHQITRMQRRGLVTKCKSPGDARGVLVCVTDDGLERLGSAAPQHVESIRRAIFDHLDPRDIPALTRFLAGIEAVDNVPGVEGFEGCLKPLGD